MLPFVMGAPAPPLMLLSSKVKAKGGVELGDADVHEQGARGVEDAAAAGVLAEERRRSADGVGAIAQGAEQGVIELAQ